MPKTKVVVNLADGSSYDVAIGTGILDGVGKRMRACARTQNATKVLVLADANVAPLYKARLVDSLTEASYSVRDIVIPAGEGAKTTDVLVELWRAMAQMNYGRDCVVVALGGGATCDTAGFASATFMRGVTCVYVPTTLLSMVDASVGGKTAVNLPEGKNLVGTFTQPALVCADIDTLKSLPDNEWRSGLAEVAKASVIDSDEFFFWMCDNATALAARDERASFEAIVKSVVFKANVVAADVEERKGVRECLNYGHTYGHALECLAGYATYTHGEGVAEGMRFAGILASELGLLQSDVLDAQNALLDALGLVELTWKAAPQDIIASMKGDKKVRNGVLRFVLPRDIASWEVVSVSEDKVLAALDVFLSTKE